MANKVKEIPGRLILKHDIESNWNRATTFVPKQGEIIIYDVDSNYAWERFKIGDGVTTVGNLSFYLEDDIKATHYATSGTAASTQAKVATIQNGSFTLEAGCRVAVKFTYANTAAAPTLNVNNSGAKTIYCKGATITATNYWSAGQIIDFVYDGSYWHMISDIKGDASMNWNSF